MIHKFISIDCEEKYCTSYITLWLPGILLYMRRATRKQTSRSFGMTTTKTLRSVFSWCTSHVHDTIYSAVYYKTFTVCTKKKILNGSTIINYNRPHDETIHFWATLNYDSKLLEKWNRIMKKVIYAHNEITIRSGNPVIDSKLHFLYQPESTWITSQKKLT